MNRWTHHLLTGLLLWAAAFVFSILIFPVMLANKPLFHNLMVTAMALIATPLIVHSYGQPWAQGQKLAKLGLVMGLVWLVVNLGIDLVVFPSFFQMPIGQYFSEIGSSYTLIVIQPWAMGWAADRMGHTKS